MQPNKKFVLCITGASGSLYAKTFLDKALGLNLEVECIVSENARKVIEYELEIPYGEFINFYSSKGVKFHDPKDFFSPLASGSRLTLYDGVVILPCSVGTLGAIANGIGNNLIHRVADVAIKEGVPLLLAVREMPLSAIHLENMLKLQRIGVKAFPISPPFYGKPKTLEELLVSTVGKIFDLLGVKGKIYRRWGENQ